MTQSTPTPYAVDYIKRDNIFGGGNLIAVCIGEDYDQRKANAEFITKACNAASTSILFGILEIEGHYRGKDGQRKLNALAGLREATINGHDVLAVIHDSIDEEPKTVKHFGCDIRCGFICPHDPLPWGVKRYFGIHLIVSGDWDLVNYPLRYWVNPNAQIEITGKVMPFDGQRTELQAV